MALLEIGSQAPDFTLPSSEGKDVSLKSFEGKVVVLYFYPKDFTPGCTKEACSFRDSFQLFKDKGIEVLGVSYDPVTRHEKFKAKYSLPFTLLTDVDKSVSKKYGAEGVLTSKRVTYVIGKDGKIIAVFPKVNVSAHAQEVLEVINKYSTTP